MSNEPFPMETIIAERQLVAFNQNGKHIIVVRLGAPMRFQFPYGREPMQDPNQRGIFRCPLQITGLDLDHRVFPISGADAFEALQYAIDFAGQLLADGYARLNLENRAHFDASTPDHWIWRYPSE